MVVVCEICGFDGASEWFLQCKNHERCHQGRHLYCIDGLRVRRRPASLGAFGVLECSWCLQTAESTSQSAKRNAALALDKSAVTRTEGQRKLKEGNAATAREAKPHADRPAANKVSIAEGAGPDKVPAGKVPFVGKPTAGKAASTDRCGKALDGGAAGGKEEVHGDKKRSAAGISSQRAVAGGSGVPSATATAATGTASLPESMAGAQCGRYTSKAPGAIPGRASGMQHQSRVKPATVVAGGAATMLVADELDGFYDRTLLVKQNKVAGPSARSQLAGAGQQAVIAGDSGTSKPGSVLPHGRPISTKQNVGGGLPVGAPPAGSAGAKTGGAGRTGQTGGGGAEARGASLAGAGTVFGSHAYGVSSLAARNRPTVVAAPTGRVSFHYQLALPTVSSVQSSSLSQTKLDNRDSLARGSRLGSLPLHNSSTQMVVTSRDRRVRLWTFDMVLEGCIPRTEMDPKRLRMSIESISPHESMVRLSKLLQAKTPPEGLRCSVMRIEEVPRAISEAHSFYLLYNPCETCVVMYPTRNIGNTSKFFKESLITMLLPPEVGNEQGAGERAQLEEPGKILAVDLSFLTADDLAKDPVLERLLHSELDTKGDSKTKYQLYFMPETVPVDGVTPENGVMPCLLSLTGSRKHVHLMVPPYNRRIPTEEESILINPTRVRRLKKVTFELRDNHKHETGRLLKETIQEGKALKKVLLEQGESTAADPMECDIDGSAYASEPGSMGDGPVALDPNVETLHNAVLMASSSQPAGSPVVVMHSAEKKGLLQDTSGVSDPGTQQALGIDVVLTTPSQPEQLVGDAEVTIGVTDGAHSLIEGHATVDSGIEVLCQDAKLMAPLQPAGSLSMCWSASFEGSHSAKDGSLASDKNNQQELVRSATRVAAARAVVETGMKNNYGEAEMSSEMAANNKTTVQFVCSIDAIGRVAEQQACTSALGDEALDMLAQYQQALATHAPLSDDDTSNSGGGAASVADVLFISGSNVTSDAKNNPSGSRAPATQTSGPLPMAASICTVEGTWEPLNGMASNGEAVDAARSTGIATDCQLSDWRGLANCRNPPPGLHCQMVLPIPNMPVSVEVPSQEHQWQVGKKRPRSPLHSVARQAGLNLSSCKEAAQWSWGRVSAPVLQAFLMESGCMDLACREQLLPDLIPQLQALLSKQLHGCQIRLVALAGEASMLENGLDRAAKVLGFQWSSWCKAVDCEKLSGIQVVLLSEAAVSNVPNLTGLVLKSIAVHPIALYRAEPFVKGLMLLAEETKYIHKDGRLAMALTLEDVLSRASLQGAAMVDACRPLYPTRVVVVMDAEGFMRSPVKQLVRLAGCLLAGSRTWGMPWQLQMRASHVSKIMADGSPEHWAITTWALRPDALTGGELKQQQPMLQELDLPEESATVTHEIVLMRDAAHLMYTRRPGRLVVAAYAAEDLAVKLHSGKGRRCKDILAGTVSEVVSFLDLLLSGAKITGQMC
ncbi:hypothetical protein VaNZ11_009915 [Volvox africanus]|uniref:Uncharacterized protein n=1 Tax=Volvox africanus TaxID=51714 RepID=A0ABQ5S8J7_9CHLO|nr:hypothetical protein VaNZ11_009915 [Volvox africanus]